MYMYVYIMIIHNLLGAYINFICMRVSELTDSTKPYV